MNVIVRPFRPHGNILAQPSKSDSHRKIICGALSGLPCTIDNVVLSEDIRATIEALGSAGRKIKISDSTAYPGRKFIQNEGIRPEQDGVRFIDCRESGSTLRFMSMIFAVIGGRTVLTGRGRLPERPMEHALEFFRRYGISYSIPGNGIYLPLEISGSLSGKEYEVESSVSSQFISGLMMGVAAASRKAVIKADGAFESKGYVDLTAGVLEEYGVEVTGDNPYSIDATGGIQQRDTIVEGDWSNASYFIAMGRMGGSLKVRGLQDYSRQPDRVIVELLDEMSDGTDNDINVSEFPDLMPTLAAYAAILPVNTTITGKRLRYKESDRIGAVCRGLRAIGIDAAELEDGIRIKGGSTIDGGVVDSCNDHRIAMAFAILGCVSRKDIVIEDAGCVEKSYPDFFRDLVEAGGIIS